MESAGMDAFWVGEAYGFDAVSMLGYLAGHTRTAELGSGILPVYSRSPALTAMTAAGLDFVSSGRFVLGIGVSGPQVVEGWYGVPFRKPLAATRDAIEVCRRVWARERLEYHGDTFDVPVASGPDPASVKPLRMLNHPLRPDIPIFLAALGPRNVALAAELAEGWIPFFFHPEKADVWSEHLARGAALRSPDRKPLEVVAGGPVALCGKEEADRLLNAERAHVALYVGGMGSASTNFYNDLFVRYGYEKEARAMQSLYLAGRRTEAEALVPADYLSGTSLVGDEGHIRDRIDAYKSAGVTYLSLTFPAGYDRDSTVRLVEKLRAWADR